MRAHCIWLVGLVVAFGAFAQDRVEGPVTEEGELDGAPFLIEIPENWNGGLLMYAHGYVIAGQTPQYNRPMVTVGHRLGYAVAQSKYSKQGWAAEQGILETEALRKYFTEKYGATYPTIIAGHSQGGFISFATIERYPEHYDGALPMCGSGEPALKFFKERVFDMRLLFDYYFPGMEGSVVEFPHGRQTIGRASAKVRELIEADPEAAEWYADYFHLPGVGSIPGVVGFWSEILREFHDRAGGNPFDNRNTVYSGTPDDGKLNAEIERYAADPKAQAYLREWVTIRGTISDPVVALHTLVDELVPAQSTDHYVWLTQAMGTEEYFVQLYTEGGGHCAFTEDETHEALLRLHRWIVDEKRPAAGLVKGN